MRYATEVVLLVQGALRGDEAPGRAILILDAIRPFLKDGCVIDDEVEAVGREFYGREWDVAALREGFRPHVERMIAAIDRVRGR